MAATESLRLERALVVVGHGLGIHIEMGSSGTGARK